MLRQLLAFQDGPYSHSLPWLSSATAAWRHKSTLRHVLHHSTHLHGSQQLGVSYTHFLKSPQNPLPQSTPPLYIPNTRVFDSKLTISSSQILLKQSFCTVSLSASSNDLGPRDIPQKVHLLSHLAAFSSPRYLLHGLQIHCCILQFRNDLDVVVGTALLNMYSKCGSLEDARGVFDRLWDRDVVLWTAIITAYAKRGLVADALHLFDSMLQAKVTPDALSFVSILNACGSCHTVDIQGLYGQIISAGLDMEFGIGSALLNLHVKRGNKTEARALFEKLPKNNRITWNPMISLYVNLGHFEEALQLYHDMLQEGLIPDSITFVAILQSFSCKSSLHHVRQMHVCILAAQLASNMILLTALMNAYGKCRSAEGVLGTWECIASKNVIVWSALIGILTQLRLGEQALDCLSRMLEEGILPNEVTYASSLDACSLQAKLTRGKHLHACLDSSGAFVNMSLVTALLNLYNRCSDLDEVKKLFDIAKLRDVMLWTAALSAHTSHNQRLVAAQMFYQMQEEGVLPNLVTYISVLEACATPPSLALGKQVHTLIGSRDTTNNVDVGTALINMYGKCGCLDYARSVFDVMATKDRLSWTSIVSVYAHNGEEKEALKSFELMIRQGVLPDNVTFLSIMSSCTHSGLLELGIGLFFSMKNEFGLEPLESHYDCVIDLFGRAGQLNVAEQLLNHMPAKPSEVSWTTMLGACRNNIDSSSR